MQAKPTLMRALLMTMFVLLMCPGAPADDAGPQADPEAHETEQPQTAVQVRMAELRINGRRVVGRLMDESEESVKVRIPGSGTITFAKELHSDVNALHEKLSGLHTRLRWADRDIDRQGERIRRNRRSLHRLHEDMEWLKDEVDDQKHRLRRRGH